MNHNIRRPDDNMDNAVVRNNDVIGIDDDNNEENRVGAVESNDEDPLLRLSDAQRLAVQGLKRHVKERFEKDNLEAAMPNDLELVQHFLSSMYNNTSSRRRDNSTNAEATAARIRQQVNDLYHKVECLYYWRREYDILDTVQEGMAAMTSLLEDHPGFVLHFEVRPQGVGGRQHAMLIVDFCALNYSLFQDEPRSFLVGMYYIFQACYPHLEAIRVGHIDVIECEGMSMMHHLMHVPLFMKFAQELGTYYPLHWHSSYSYNTPTALNVLYALLKPYAPEHYKTAVKMGCRAEEEDMAIRELFSPPPSQPPAIGCSHVNTRGHRFWTEFRNALTLRYYNQVAFKLEKNLSAERQPQPPPQEQSSS